jgi:recombination protein RecT
MQLDKLDGEFQSALPAHIPVGLFKRVVMTAIQNNPDLLAVDRRSLFNSAMRAAQDGLLPDGREGAMVVYRGKTGQIAQWMPMISGIRKKVRNSGEIATWDAHVVYERDVFKYQLGDKPFIHHEPTMGERGSVIGAYSIAVLKTGEMSREVMSVSEIEAVRKRSRASGNGPWVTDYAEMCRKTVARRHSKVLPMSTDLDDLIRRDDELYDMAGAGDAAVKPAATRQTTADKLALIGGAKDVTPSLPGENDDFDDAAQGAPQAGPGPAPDSPADAAGPGPGDPQDAADSEEPAVTDEQLAAARQQGDAARRAGRKASACPADLRKSQRLFDAWNDGWAEADESLQNNG